MRYPRTKFLLSLLFPPPSPITVFRSLIINISAYTSNTGLGRAGPERLCSVSIGICILSVLTAGRFLAVVDSCIYLQFNLHITLQSPKGADGTRNLYIVVEYKPSDKLSVSIDPSLTRGIQKSALVGTLRGNRNGSPDKFR
jgi:hypothetical protein